MSFRNLLLILALALALGGGLVAQTAGSTYYLKSQIGAKNLVMGSRGDQNINGAQMELTIPSGLAGQKITLEDAGGGYFYFRTGLGRYVHVQDISAEPKKLALLWESRGRDNTKWKFVPMGNGIYFIQSKMGTWLDVQWAKTTAGTPIWMWTRNGGEAQQWKLEEVGGDSGSSSGAVLTKFTPQQHGFNFTNRFDNHGHHFGYDMNFPGLCGGMSYAVLDYYHAAKAVPSTSTTPTEGNQLTNYIRGRQWKTYENQADKWAELFVNPFGWRTNEFFNWGIQGYNGGRLEELRKRIDAGQPVPLGLFAAGSGGVTSSHHQVVAYGYKLNGYAGRFGANADNLEIYIYDPNCPNQKRTLMASTSKLRYYYKEEPHKKWLTYFVDMKYRSTRPLDPSVSNRCSGKNLERKNYADKNMSGQSYRCLKGNYLNARGAKVHGSDFFKAELKEAVFYGADCQGSTFQAAQIERGDFEGANLYNTTFADARLVGSRFYGADMRLVKAQRAVFDGANLEGADLHKGNYKLASFKKARLYGTSLNSADCSSVDFSGANLDGADLRGAILTNANFANAKITQHTKCDSGVQGKVRNWPGIRPR